MFSFVVKRLGFLKTIPLTALFFDSLIKIWMFISNPKMLEWLDEIEEEVLSWNNTSVNLHKYGGIQFDYKGKEIGHVHSNGLLDVLFSKKSKMDLIKEGRIADHHVLKNSGWISFYIHNQDDVDYAKRLLKMAYEKNLN